MVMEVVHEDAGDGSMQCTNHPYKNSTAGGICAFCLQEKLGKLVSSSYPAAVFPSSSSSPSPSFRSSLNGAAAASESNDCARKSKSRLGFVKKKDEKSPVSATLVFKRSKSTANYQDYSPNRWGFWSFFKKSEKDSNFTPPVTVNGENRGNENVGPDETAIDRRVSRSRSVGCGSRSFSGDLFERISTGFGDCTLRRVESQREGRPRMHKNGDVCIKGRVKCGGIFSGFMLTTSSSYLIASSSDQENGKSMSAAAASEASSLGHVCHGRSKSWGWAFASPMRAFGKNSAVKRGDSLNKNATPNLAAVPSLLA